MTIRKLASQVAKDEGLGVQVSIGNVREILRVLAEIAAEDEEAHEALIKYIERKRK